MAKKLETTVTFGEAIDALKGHAAAWNLWRAEATTLLKMVGQDLAELDDAARKRLAEMCNECADKAP